MPRLHWALAGAVVLAAALPALASEGGTAEPGMLTLTSTVDTGDSNPTEQWFDHAKHPTSWLTWGADERMRWEYLDNGITLNEKAPGHVLNFQRYRSRVWSTVAPCKEFEVGARLAWEGRHWCAPAAKKDWDWAQAFFDNLYAKVRPMPNLTLTIGRQDIIMGDGWLILEGTPLDGSTSIYFDAFRATYTAKEINTTVDAIFIQQWSSPDMWLPTMNDTDRAQIEQNERGAVLYVTNKSIQNLEASGYFIYKNDEKVLANGDQGDIYTPGFRLAEQFTPNFGARVEVAGQWGERNGHPLCAWGMNSRATYAFKDTWNNQLFFNFEYLSGDKPGTNKNEAFDPLWGRWPQFSELYVYSYAGETRIAETTNLIRFGPGYTVCPTKEMELDFTYQPLFAVENSQRGRVGFSDHGNFRGTLLTGVLKYKFNQHVATHLWAEYFMPGDYYSPAHGDDAIYLRAEVVLSF